MKVEVSLSAINLSALNSFAVLTLVRKDDEEEDTELGKTEVVEDTTEPHWTKTFILDYDPDQGRRTRLQIYDNDNSKYPLVSRTATIQEILEAKGQVTAKESDGGIIIAHATEYTLDGAFTIQVRGENLKNIDGFFNKSDPFFVIEREGKEVFRSETMKENLNPTWPVSQIELSELCDGILDLQIPLTLSLFDQENDGNHDLMGSCERTIENFLATDPEEDIVLLRDGDERGNVSILEVGMEGFTNNNEAAKTAMNAVANVERLKVAIIAKEENAKNLAAQAEEKDEEAQKLAEEAKAAHEEADAAVQEAEEAKADYESALAALESL